MVSTVTISEPFKAAKAAVEFAYKLPVHSLYKLDAKGNELLVKLVTAGTVQTVLSVAVIVPKAAILPFVQE